MSIFATGITFAFVLLGVCLLFMQPPRKGKRDWPERFAIAVLLAALTFSSWLWQYSKFVNKHGLFYSISPTYGMALLTALETVIFIVVVSIAWKDRND